MLGCIFAYVCLLVLVSGCVDCGVHLSVSLCAYECLWMYVLGCCSVTCTCCLCMSELLSVCTWGVMLHFLACLWVYIVRFWAHLPICGAVPLSRKSHMYVCISLMRISASVPECPRGVKMCVCSVNTAESFHRKYLWTFKTTLLPALQVWTMFVLCTWSIASVIGAGSEQRVGMLRVRFSLCLSSEVCVFPCLWLPWPPQQPRCLSPEAWTLGQLPNKLTDVRSAGRILGRSSGNQQPRMHGTSRPQCF